MSNLFNLGRTGLIAAQAGLNTTGHNVANVHTPGFSRQQVVISTAGGQGGSSGYFGSGVQVDSVRRIYDGFLTQQLNASTAASGALSSYSAQVDRINNLLADNTVGISPALSRFFEGVNAVASNPADAAARQEMLGRAESLVSQLQTANQFLAEQQLSVNQQIDTNVKQINSYAERISNLNQAIVTARASVSGQVPNDLLDQRDQLVTELNELIAVTVITDGDSINLAVGNGQTILAGTQVFPLKAVQSDSDPSRTAVAYTTGDGTPVELKDQVLKGGMLGGLLQFRSETLDTTQNQLGRIAISLAHAFNEVHKQGGDLAGEQGEDFFSLQPLVAMKNAANTGTASFTLEITDASKLSTDDYVLTYDQPNGVYHLTTQKGRSLGSYTVSQLEAGHSFEGLTLTLGAGATSADKDSFVLQPTRHGARDLAVAISDPAKIAASAYDAGDPAVGGSANGENALKLAALQTAKTMGGLGSEAAGVGTMSITEGYSQIVNHIGVQAQAIQSASKAQDTLTAQSFAAQQAVSGVNLNEEYINLDFYVQHYQASARLIDVAGTLFDTILGLRA